MENQKEKLKKGTHGGLREGAGRKATVANMRSIALRIPKDVADILDRQPNRSAFIVAAIRAYASQQH